jgi:GntR family transcriptional regulator
VIPFQLPPGSAAPLHEQVVFAAKQAIVSGRLKRGEAFPSVRALSRELKIHANTAQKAITQLRQEGLIEVRPGIGTVVAQPAAAARTERLAVMRPEIEQLTVEAIRMGVSLEEFQEIVAASWRRLQKPEEVRK